jgi:hypothetical protein
MICDCSPGSSNYRHSVKWTTQKRLSEGKCVARIQMNKGIW